MGATEQRKILEWMLGQAERAEGRKRQLEARLARMKRRKGWQTSARYKMAEIEERINAQWKETEKSIVRVMDIIDFIPQGEVARQIFEL